MKKHLEIHKLFWLINSVFLIILVYIVISFIPLGNAAKSTFANPIPMKEKLEIIPAISEANALGLTVEGPIPPDTLFSKAKGGFYDGCVAMFHDQGHIPFKLEGFIWDVENERMKSVQGVNITLGLPIIRSSVDHGTAFEIAGKGVASPDALLLAIEYAVRMAQNKLHDT